MVLLLRVGSWPWRYIQVKLLLEMSSDISSFCPSELKLWMTCSVGVCLPELCIPVLVGVTQEAACWRGRMRVITFMECLLPPGTELSLTYWNISVVLWGSTSYQVRKWGSAVLGVMPGRVNAETVLHSSALCRQGAPCITLWGRLPLLAPIRSVGSQDQGFVSKPSCATSSWVTSW